MIVVNIFENIIKYIDKGLNFIFSASRDSYTPLNFENIKFLAFMLGLFLFLLENVITIFLRSLSDTINAVLSSGNEVVNNIFKFVFNKSLGEWDSFYFNPHNYIKFDTIFLIALILSFINIFFIKNKQYTIDNKSSDYKIKQNRIRGQKLSKKKNIYNSNSNSVNSKSKTTYDIFGTFLILSVIVCGIHIIFVQKDKLVKYLQK